MAAARGRSRRCAQHPAFTRGGNHGQALRPFGYAQGKLCTRRSHAEAIMGRRSALHPAFTRGGNHGQALRPAPGRGAAPPLRLPGDGLRPFEPQTGVATSVSICHALKSPRGALGRRTLRPYAGHRPHIAWAAERKRARLAAHDWSALGWCAGGHARASLLGVRRGRSPLAGVPRGLAPFGPRAAAHAAHACGTREDARAQRHRQNTV